jgi:nucleotide-binding universal stress UspA family protein
VRFGGPSDGHTGEEMTTALVGIDGSLNSRVALEHAAQRVGPEGRLILASVIKPGSAVVATSVVVPGPDRRTAARELAERLAGDVAVETAIEVAEGSPSEQLAALAREHDADEIVVGSRGLGTVRAALGSVSHALLHETDRVVVVIPAG